MVPQLRALTSGPCLDGPALWHPPSHTQDKLTRAPAQTSWACHPGTEAFWYLDTSCDVVLTTFQGSCVWL